MFMGENAFNHLDYNPLTNSSGSTCGVVKVAASIRHSCYMWSSWAKYATGGEPFDKSPLRG